VCVCVFKKRETFSIAHQVLLFPEIRLKKGQT